MPELDPAFQDRIDAAIYCGIGIGIYIGWIIGTLTVLILHARQEARKKHAQS